MKVLIAASNELPAKDEGLEALWDRFLVRMVSNCIRNESLFFKMIKSEAADINPLEENLYITEDIYYRWQSDSKGIDIQPHVVNVIKALRKTFEKLEKEDGNNLKYYISDRRWRKSYRLMQTSAYLNGRTEINLSDYLLLIHCFWTDVESIPHVIKAVTSSVSEDIVRQMKKIDDALRHIMNGPQEGGDKKEGMSSEMPSIFAEYDYFYYLVENYPDGETYFSKWDYLALTDKPRDAVKYYDIKRKKQVIHTLIAGGTFDVKTSNATNLTKIKIQKCHNGAIINGTPYSFRRKGFSISFQSIEEAGVDGREDISDSSLYARLASILKLFKSSVREWEEMIELSFSRNDNIFLSQNDLKLVEKMTKEISEIIKTVEVKMNNVMLMLG